MEFCYPFIKTAKKKGFAMLRMFPEHKVRPVLPLDGLWELRAGDGGECFPAVVPGVWEAIPALARYRGTAEYSRTFRLDRAGGVLFRFGGVSHTASVLLDGKELGSHYDAFMAFHPQSLLQNEE